MTNQAPVRPAAERPLTNKEYAELSRLDGEMVKEPGPLGKSAHPFNEGRRRALERQLDIYGRA